MQTRLESLVEAFINCVLGYLVSFMANAIILPMVGIPVTIKQNLMIGAFYDSRVCRTSVRHSPLGASSSSPPAYRHRQLD